MESPTHLPPYLPRFEKGACAEGTKCLLLIVAFMSVCRYVSLCVQFVAIKNIKETFLHIKEMKRKMLILKGPANTPESTWTKNLLPISKPRRFLFLLQVGDLEIFSLSVAFNWLLIISFPECFRRIGRKQTLQSVKSASNQIVFTSSAFHCTFVFLEEKKIIEEVFIGPGVYFGALGVVRRIFFGFRFDNKLRKKREKFSFVLFFSISVEK